MTTSASLDADEESMPIKPQPRLPRVTDPVPPAEASSEPNAMFRLLVENEDDVTGLLAYGLYKQNKRDWLIAHQAGSGRAPTQAELDAFILGERIPRRVATYRRLAEDMLAARTRGQAEKPSRPILEGLMTPPANDATSAAAAMASAARKPITWRYIAFLLAMLVAMAIIFRLAASWLFGTGR